MEKTSVVIESLSLLVSAIALVVAVLSFYVMLRIDKSASKFSKHQVNLVKQWENDKINLSKTISETVEMIAFFEFEKWRKETLKWKK